MAIDCFFDPRGLRERFGRPPGRQNEDFILFFASGEAPGSDSGAILDRCWLEFGAVFEAILANFKVLWCLFSLLFFLAGFGFFGLFVALGLSFLQGFSWIEPDSREKTAGTVGNRSQL